MVRQSVAANLYARAVAFLDWHYASIFVATETPDGDCPVTMTEHGNTGTGVAADARAGFYLAQQAYWREIRAKVAALPPNVSRDEILAFIDKSEPKDPVVEQIKNVKIED